MSCVHYIQCAEYHCSRCGVLVSKQLSPKNPLDQIDEMRGQPDLRCASCDGVTGPLDFSKLKRGQLSELKHELHSNKDFEVNKIWI